MKITVESVVEILKNFVEDKNALLGSDTVLGSLAMDSLSALEFIFSIEEKYNIKIDESLLDAEKILQQTVGDLVILLDNIDK